MRLTFFTLVLLCHLMASATTQSDEAAPLVTAARPYAPESLVSGELSIVGSRTMSELAAIWRDSFRHVHPEAEINLDFQGSGTAIELLASQPSTLGLMSRKLSTADRQAFAETGGGEALLSITAAYDALAVIVHPDNPVEQLTFTELRRLFGLSKPDSETTWGDVGLQGEWSDRQVACFTPGDQSGSKEFFRQLVLKGSEFAAGNSMDWHREIVTAVSRNPAAIGFVSLANSRSDGIRVMPIVANDGEAARSPAAGSLSHREYSLIRPLTIVCRVRKDATPDDPLTTEFLRYVLSRNGQDDVVKLGFQSLDRSELLTQFDRLGWHQDK